MKLRKWIVGAWLMGAGGAIAGDAELQDPVVPDDAYAWLARVERAERETVTPSPDVFDPSGGSQGCVLPFVERASADSAMCMTCHDGSNPGAFEVRHDVSHKMDFDYAELWRAKADPDLEERPALVMPKGKLTCTTCHDAEPGLKDWIAKPNKQLCLSCHRMN